MKKTFWQLAGAALLVLLAMTALPLSAQAAGTASGVPISNTASVIYSVGAVTQPAISTGPTATFVVDNKVNLTVAKFADATVVPGSTDRVLVFTVTNNGNTPQSYALSVVSRATDTFDMGSIRIFRDVNGNNAYEAGTDVLYVDPTTFPALASDATYTVLVVADTPTGLNNGDTAVQDLVATTWNSGGGLITSQTTTATAGVDVVFADIAGSDSGDIARDGKHSAFGTYTVNAAAITILKSAVTYSDPFNGSTNPKAIPGAVITYTITVSNAAGGQDATNVTITDAIPANVTFKTQYDDGIAPSNPCNAGYGIVVDADGAGAGLGVCKLNTTTADGADFNVTAGNTVTVSGLTVNAGTEATVKFQVTIN